ncbi:unnamed protein product [Enterobius vermicularis]|uniref:Methyltransferase-like protein 9 n=1 Tax=Enterobius vermicularis TaxID=51028 RepID=A0A0N4V663_ENTVE|nr:unnamed protein product [Enterobius vermicularis]
MAALPAPVMGSFYQFHPDSSSQEFLNRSLETSNLYYTLASSMLSFFLTKTSINGILGRGGMFIFSSEQLRDFLSIGETWNRDQKKLLDLGAGDGQVTEILANYFADVTVTEASMVMAWRLRQHGFTVTDKELWAQTGPYDLVSALNLLDRHYDPHALLRDLHQLTYNSNCLLLMAVVLPLKQYVEFHPYKNSTKPDTFLRLKGETFEEQFISLVDDILAPSNFEVVRWGKLPYLCEGDHEMVNKNLLCAYYQLDDAVLLLRPTAKTVPHKAVKEKPNFLREKEDL